jgi:hypothetical protein
VKDSNYSIHESAYIFPNIKGNIGNKLNHLPERFQGVINGVQKKGSGYVCIGQGLSVACSSWTVEGNQFTSGEYAQKLY